MSNVRIVSSLSELLPEQVKKKSLIEILRKFRKDCQKKKLVESLSEQRLYPIPRSVQKIAQKGLDQRKEFSRGGTSVGLNTAKRLASGKPLSLRKVKHISKYFPRHAKDNLKQADPPSNGLIAWNLWGGDSAKSWTSKILNSP
jgi:ribosomal protein S21